jgi:hypothetical protein
MFRLLILLALFCAHTIAFADTLPGFSASFDHKKRMVQVRWEQGQSSIHSYTVQRSNDNKHWQDIGVHAVNRNGGTRSFYFEDRNPVEGENHYRVRSTYDNKAIDFSRSVMIITPPVAKGWVMYPIPAKDFVTLEYRGADQIKGVINVFIHQSSGRIISRLRSSSLNRSVTIPVHNLGAGVYDVRIIVQGELVWNQRFVK